jgi:hypothetical protein
MEAQEKEEKPESATREALPFERRSKKKASS